MNVPLGFSVSANGVVNKFFVACILIRSVCKSLHSILNFFTKLLEVTNVKEVWK